MLERMICVQVHLDISTYSFCTVAIDDCVHKDHTKYLPVAASYPDSTFLCAVTQLGFSQGIVIRNSMLK